jgi:hypothetical protein
MKRLISKVIQRSLNALMGGGSLPLNTNHVIAIEGKKEMSQASTRTVDLPWNKGKITYRIPNAIEQLRFQSAAKWYDEVISKDGALRLSYAIEAIPPYIIVLSDIALDLAGKRVPEPEKKP